MKNSLIASLCLAVAWSLCGPAAAAPPSKTMFKCVDAVGVTTFQGQPCTAGAKQSEVKLREPPKEAEPPLVEEPQIDPETGEPIDPNKPLISYECTSAQGWTFYKHKPCPPGVRVAKPGAAASDKADVLAATQGEWVRVSGAPISRLEACHRIAEGGTRQGRPFDDVVSERDRAAGRDPCRQK
ncbi:MAG TPA: DUF4124 domain-containing protein [Tahibacter sp.]|nr:DUF4124 domain-containing protein [Tahibacter sp.]